MSFTVELSERDMRDIVAALALHAQQFSGPAHQQMLGLAMRLRRIVGEPQIEPAAQITDEMARRCAMSERKRTPSPGPWHHQRMRGGETFTVYDADGEVVEHVESGDTAERNEANACLIAASPRMYAYIAKHVAAGDKDAAEIIAAID